jgi:hypothetical protein
LCGLKLLVMKLGENVEGCICGQHVPGCEENLSRDNECQGRDSNLTLHEFGVITTQPQHVVEIRRYVLISKGRRNCLFICSLFSNIFFSYSLIVSNENMISDRRIGKGVEGRGRGVILRYYFGICLEGLRKTTKNSG